jgi:hypothetical protein
VKGFINGENDVIDTSVADHYIKIAASRLKNSLEHFLIQPKEHLQTYGWFNLIFLGS